MPDNPEKQTSGEVDRTQLDLARRTGDGTYTIDVRVEPPTFGRHDRQNGDRYGESVAVTFEDVDIGAGQG